MRKYSHKTINYIVDRAIKEFMKDDSAPFYVGFYFHGHYVCATIDWSYDRSCYYVLDFLVYYSRSVMRYAVNEDFVFDSACCLLK